MPNLLVPEGIMPIAPALPAGFISTASMRASSTRDR